MKKTRSIFKLGNSLAATIPHDQVKSKRLKVGDQVYIHAEKVER